MRQQALRARPKRRARPVAQPNGTASIAPNTLDRKFQASAPNQKWAADFTYLWTAEGWLYVAVVIDLYARRVIGWSMKPEMTSQLVIDALMMAVWRRGKPEAVMHHSDRGSQYTSEQFQRLLAELGIACSMSRSGNCWDNSAMEASSHRSRLRELPARHTAHVTKLGPTSSTTLSAFTIPFGATLRLDT